MHEGRVSLHDLLDEIKNREPVNGFRKIHQEIISTLEDVDAVAGKNRLPIRFRIKFAIGALAQGKLIGVVTESEYRKAIICGIDP